MHQAIGIPSNPQLTQVGVESLSSYFEVIETYATGKTWWFRGEAREYPFPGLPKFARPYVDGSLSKASLELLIEPQTAGNGYAVVVSCITKQEIQIIEEFKANPPDDEFFEKLVGETHNGAGWLSFAQHYGKSTRLLDVTTDPLVALFFACQDHLGEDGFVWLYPQPVNIHGVHEYSDYEETFDVGVGGGVGAQGISFFKEGRIQDFYPSSDIEPLKNNFLLEIPHPNKRIVAQRGAFLWSPSPLQALTQNGFVVRIRSAAKATLLDRLSAFGIHAVGLNL